jgi:hypothetical protein
MIGQVASFLGSAFPITVEAVSLIHFGENSVMLMPSLAGKFNEQTSRATVPGWSQGIALEQGDGRVVAFGEAAMFSSQRNGQPTFGNDPSSGERQPATAAECHSVAVSRLVAISHNRASSIPTGQDNCRSWPG